MLRYPDGDPACPGGNGPCLSPGVLFFDFCIVEELGLDQRMEGQA